jgi:hypothetical protein
VLAEAAITKPFATVHMRLHAERGPFGSFG